jgi:hypothetical protein
MVNVEPLAERLRKILARQTDCSEVKMFGGIAFLISGNMCVAASKQGLLMRLGKEADTTSQPTVRAMVMRGRPMAGYFYHDPPPGTDAALAKWVDECVAFVRTLPKKAAKSQQKIKGPTT